MRCSTRRRGKFQQSRYRPAAKINTVTQTSTTCDYGLDICKGKVVPLYTKKAYRGSGSTDPLISLTSTLYTGERSTSHPSCFTSGERCTWYPQNWKLTGPHGGSGNFGQIKYKNEGKLPCYCASEILSQMAHQLSILGQVLLTEGRGTCTCNNQQMLVQVTTLRSDK